MSFSVLLFVSDRKKRSNKESNFSLDIPLPVFMTAMLIFFEAISSIEIFNSIFPFIGVYLNAFDMRLKTIFSILSLSNHPNN